MRYELNTASPPRMIFPQREVYKTYENIAYDPTKSKIDHCFHIQDDYYYCGKTDFIENPYTRDK